VRTAPDGTTQVAFKLAPGLDPGWHPVRIRTSGSAFSEPIEIAVDVPLEPGPLAIRGICDPTDWRIGEVAFDHGTIALWVEGLPRNADVANVKVRIAGRRQQVIFVGAGQVNALLRGVTRGTHDVEIFCGNTASAPVTIRVV
jgi:hypothetical protein